MKIIEYKINNQTSPLEFVREDIEKMDKTFQTIPIELSVDNIKVVLDGQGNRTAYQTIEEALKNPLNFCPSPEKLAEDIRRRGESVKPVRVRKTNKASIHYDYELVEGRIRYWAWVIAYGNKKPIPALIR